MAQDQKASGGVWRITFDVEVKGQGHGTQHCVAYSIRQVALVIVHGRGYSTCEI